MGNITCPTVNGVEVTSPVKSRLDVTRGLVRLPPAKPHIPNMVVYVSFFTKSITKPLIGISCSDDVCSLPGPISDRIEFGRGRSSAASK